jgi:hypothetical protein
VAERPISDWLRDVDGASRGPADEAGSTAGPADDGTAWRPSPAPGRSRRLWRITALAWAGVALLVVGLGAAARVIDSSGAAPGDAAGSPGTGAAAVEGMAAAEGPSSTAGAGAAETWPSAEGAGSDGVWPLSEAGDGPGGHARTAPAGTSLALAGEDLLVAAQAAAAVRLALSGDGDPARYADLVAPEAMERLGAVTVVTVAVVLLEGTEGRWEHARLARYGVALAGDATGGPRILGPPWPLPAPAPPPIRATTAEPAPLDADLAGRVLALLDRAGYAAATVAGALPTGLPADAPPSLLLLRVHARAPGAADAEVHEVWADLEGSGRLLGALDPDPGGGADPAVSPADADPRPHEGATP